MSPAITVDEALLLADDLENLPVDQKRGVFGAVLVLAAEVRRQHAEIDALRAKLDSIGGDR